MSGQKIDLSVIMACFNSSAHMDEAINSVLAQTLGDLELILVDDCSTDNTPDIAKRYQMQDDRVLVLSLPINTGPANARNAGVRAARGEWIGILDSDDVAMPSRFEEQMKRADCDKGPIVIGSSSISIDEQGNVIKAHKYPTNHRELAKRLSSSLAFPPHSSMVYRTDIVRDLSAFNPRYLQSEDADLLFRLSEKGKLSSVSKPLVKIRKHPQNTSNSEGGNLQIRYGRIAAVCHFLRIQGCSDPSTDYDEIRWQEFVKWADRRVAEKGIYERRQAWVKTRAAYYAAENRLIGAGRFAYRLIQSNHAIALVWEKFFGSSIPRQLAREWSKRTSAGF